MRLIRRPVARAVTSLVTVAVAAVAFPRGVEDWQYQLAGLADPFLGRPAPGLTIIIGAVATLAYVLAVTVVRRLGSQRRSDGGTDAPAQRVLRPRRWWLPLAVGWAAYGLGAAVVLAGGGPRTHEATMRLDVSAPIETSVEVPATCRTPVGQPDRLAELTPVDAALPMLTFRELATGRRDRWPHGIDVIVELVPGDGTTAAYPLPNVPDRPLPYLLLTHLDGTTERERPITFLEAYDYRVTRVAAEGMSGSLEIGGTRFQDPYGGGVGPGSVRWVDLEIADDPWPPTIGIRVSWSCRS